MPSGSPTIIHSDSSSYTPEAHISQSQHGIQLQHATASSVSSLERTAGTDSLQGDTGGQLFTSTAETDVSKVNGLQLTLSSSPSKSRVTEHDDTVPNSLNFNAETTGYEAAKRKRKVENKLCPIYGLPNGISSFSHLVYFSQ